jgi:CBS domain-containing protein
MKVRDLMGGTPVLSVSEEDDLGLASQMMLWAGVRHLPVTRGRDVVGVLSESDVLRYEAREGLREGARAPVRMAMSAPAVVVSPDLDVEEAAGRFLDRRIGCLPVVEAGRLVGLLTKTDLLGHQARRQWVSPSEEGPALVTDIMRQSPEVVREDDDLLIAVARMSERGIRHLPVIDGERRVIGVLSDRDVRTVLGDPSRTVGAVGVEGDDEGASEADAGGRLEVHLLKVAHVMTAPPLVVRASEPLPAVARHFLDWRVGALPVVDEDERLVGMVSYLDVLGATYHLLYEVPRAGGRADGGAANRNARAAGAELPHAPA